MLCDQLPHALIFNKELIPLLAFGSFKFSMIKSTTSGESILIHQKHFFRMLAYRNSSKPQRSKFKESRDPGQGKLVNF